MRFARTWNASLIAAAVAGAIVLAPQRSGAAPLKVLSAEACERFVTLMAAEFERQGGQPVKVDVDSTARLVQRINAGERFDVALITPAGLERIVPRFMAGAAVDVARVGIGVAVRANAPRPDIRSVEGFKRSLRQARSVAYVDPAAGGTSGIYFSRLLERLGIADSIRPKAVLVPGAGVAQRVAAGDADIGIQMMSELVGVKGVALVGPLPAPIQTYTVYSGVIGASASDPAAARALLDLLRNAQAAGALKAAGLERVSMR